MRKILYSLLFAGAAFAQPGVVTYPTNGSTISTSQYVNFTWGTLAAPYTKFAFCVSHIQYGCYQQAPAAGTSFTSAPDQGFITTASSYNMDFSFLQIGSASTIYVLLMGSTGWNGSTYNWQILTIESFTLVRQPSGISIGAPYIVSESGGSRNLDGGFDYTIAVTDSAGGADAQMYLAFTPGLFASSGVCAMAFNPNGGNAILNILTDGGQVGDGSRFAGDTVSNSQCTLMGNSASFAGNTATYSFTVAFRIAGFTNLWAWSQSVSQSQYIGPQVLLESTPQFAPVTYAPYPQDTGVDDSTGNPAPVPDPNNPQGMILKLPNGKVHKFPRMNRPAMSHPMTWHYITGDKLNSYEYTIDNRDVDIFRVGNNPEWQLTVTRDSIQKPKQWFGGSGAYSAGMEDAERSEFATYRFSTPWKPGIVPTYTRDMRGKSVYSFPMQEDYASNMVAAAAVGVLGSSKVDYAIGPAFAPDATPADIMKAVTYWVKWGFTVFQPFLDAKGAVDSLQSIHAEDEISRQGLECLRAVLGQ